MSAEPGFDLRVEASVDRLHDIRDYIDRTGARLGVNDGALADLRLVVDEAVTNIVLHGYQGGEGPVELHMERDGDAVVIRIRDRASPFSADSADQVAGPQLDTALEDRPFGGMGLFLIRRMTDESEFRTLPDGGNELRLVKRGAFDAGT